MQSHQRILSWVCQDNRLRILSVVVVFGLLLLGFSVNGQKAHASAACTGKTYTIVWGDTLSQIASRYKTTWEILASVDAIADPNLIYAGQSLCIPARGSVSSNAAQSAPINTAAKSVAPAPPTTTASAPTQVESGSVASMISEVFGAYASSATSIATCESGLNPSATNPSSGAAGLFQILPSTWSTTSEAGSSPYSAKANILAAHEIFVRDGYSWREWVC